MNDPIRAFLVEIGRVPLLSREQEIDYGKQVQQMMLLLSLKKTLAKKLRREPTAGEWAAQVQLTQTELNQTLRQGQRAKQKMVEANLRLVVAIAKNYQQRNVELLDLVQEGTIGLTRGVEKFDPAKGYRFSTYAYHWIRQAITRAIAEKSRTIRLPIHIIEKLNKIKKVQRQLSQKLGSTPTVAELAAELGFTQKQVQDCLKRAQLPLSLDLRVGDNQDTDLGELLEDTGASPEGFVTQSCMATDLEQLMADLTPQQTKVLTLRYGLADGQPLTLAAIGKHLNLSRERVRQVENSALKQLRQHQGSAERLIDYYQ